MTNAIRAAESDHLASYLHLAVAVLANIPTVLMTAYLHSWLSPRSHSDESVPTIVNSSASLAIPGAFTFDDDNDDAETIRGQSPAHNDVPPAFPSLNSAQRIDSSGIATATATSIPRIMADCEHMPPPPVPRFTSGRRAGPVPPSESSTNALAVPSKGNLLTLPSTSSKPLKVSRKVALAPGHGPLDWANLKKSASNLRVCGLHLYAVLSFHKSRPFVQGVDTLLRVTSSMLKQHNKREDAWSAFHGKVYNITPYLSFHPGGEKELMRVAGRDGTKLFCEHLIVFDCGHLLTPKFVSFDSCLGER